MLPYYHIAFCINDSYWLRLPIVIKSIIKNSNENYVFHIFYNFEFYSLDTFVSSLKQLNINYTLYPLTNNIWSNLKSCSYLWKSSYYRLYIPHIIDSSISKILYLDADIIVNWDLKNLFSIDLWDHLLWLTYENHPYKFNTGVMLINLEKRRKDSVTDLLLDYIDKNPEKITEADQSAINDMINKNDIVVFQTRYNLTLQYFYYTKWLTLIGETLYEEINKWVIFHFNWKRKPWNLFCLHPWVKYIMENDKIKLVYILNYIFSSTIILSFPFIKFLFKTKLFSRFLHKLVTW